MIRRDYPRVDQPSHWLLIPQREHARLSYELATAWGNEWVSPLIGPADSHDTVMLSVRDELLSAIRLHDEGWADWEAAPHIDDAHARPYGFTEMPPAEAQRLWSASIDTCRQIGPLAGWIVAGHFIRLQSDHDADYPQWAPWLAAHQQSRQQWLAEWQALDSSHSLALAEQALYYLRTFDWISLWLCCRAPLSPDDPPEAMGLVEQKHAFGPFSFRSDAKRVTITPWPLRESQFEASVDCREVAVGSYRQAEKITSSSTKRILTWRLAKSMSNKVVEAQD